MLMIFLTGKLSLTQATLSLKDPLVGNINELLDENDVKTFMYNACNMLPWIVTLFVIEDGSNFGLVTLFVVEDGSNFGN